MFRLSPICFTAPPEALLWGGPVSHAPAIGGEHLPAAPVLTKDILEDRGQGRAGAAILLSVGREAEDPSESSNPYPGDFAEGAPTIIDPDRYIAGARRPVKKINWIPTV